MPNILQIQANELHKTQISTGNLFFTFSSKLMAAGGRWQQQQRRLGVLQLSGWSVGFIHRGFSPTNQNFFPSFILLNVSYCYFFKCRGKKVIPCLFMIIAIHRSRVNLWGESILGHFPFLLLLSFFIFLFFLF